MTLIPEPHDVRVLGDRARVYFTTGEEGSLVDVTEVSGWSSLGFAEAPTASEIETLTTATDRVWGAFTTAATQFKMVLESVNWDGLYLVMFAGAKGPDIRRMRKQARIRVRLRTKADRINAQLSRKGKSPWLPKAGAR